MILPEHPAAVPPSVTMTSTQWRSASTEATSRSEFDQQKRRILGES